MSKASYRREEQLENELEVQLYKNSDRQGSNSRQYRYPMSYVIESYQSGDGTLPLHFVEHNGDDNRFTALGAGLVPPAGPYSRSEALRMTPEYPAGVSYLPHAVLALVLLGLFMSRR